MTLDNKTLRDFLPPLAILAICTALIAATGLDLILERHFYQQGIWIGRDGNPWRFLYRFGVLPAYLLAACSLVTLVAGFFTARLASYRKRALFVVLLLALGPGLVVNTFFKKNWGRPRPSQLQVFDGVEKMPYHQVWERGVPGQGRSFPSGHASAAFYLIAPYFVLRRRARGYALAALAAGIGYGLLMGVARMAQGGHFPSDVLWAGGVVYLVGLILCHLMRLDAEPAI
jgi:membrane-associated PAP2 superfamily phosphatase